MIEEVGNSPIESLSKTVNAIGMKMDKDEVSKRYFGKTPKGTYFGKPKNLKTMHDLSMSESQKARLYGLGGSSVKDTGDVVNQRLETDSKSSLIKELVEDTSMTRTEAEELVRNWMEKNQLIEVDDKVLGKIIVPKGKR